MKIAIATDHNGVNEKKEIMKAIPEIEWLDKSPNNYDTDDYPDFAFAVCEALNNKEVDLGVLMCGTGIGMSIAANKVKGILAAKVNTPDEARLCREHNRANVMTLAEYTENLEAILDNYVSTQPSTEERHIRRVEKVLGLENNNE